MRSAVARLSSQNLLHNLQIIKNLAPYSKIIAMVKANAYGHGLRSTSLRLQQDLDFLGVASIDEALQLRKVGITIPIILMEGVFESEEIPIAAQQDFPIVFHHSQQLDWLAKNSQQLSDNSIKAWLKIDTGMGRLGFSLAESQQQYNKLFGNNKVAKPIGVMSHLACADVAEHPLNQQQINSFLDFCNNTSVTEHDVYKSLCNSAGIFNFSNHHYDVVRPGLALYGVSPFTDKDATTLGLKSVMTLETEIISIKDLPAGTHIGYGARFKCPRDLRVAVIAMGYGDGYPRTALDGTPVLINNKRCQLVGKISMDMAVIDLTNCLDAKISDKVTLWGDGLPIEEVAKFTQNSVYDLLTAMQNRVKFIWS
jgi:alanine racemase